jgi:hypothetical protein
MFYVYQKHKKWQTIRRMIDLWFLEIIIVCISTNTEDRCVAYRSRRHEQMMCQSESRQAHIIHQCRVLLKQLFNTKNGHVMCLRVCCPFDFLQFRVLMKEQNRFRPSVVRSWVTLLRMLRHVTLWVRSGLDITTDVRRLTTGIYSEKYVVRRFRLCGNDIECTVYSRI